MVKNSVLDNLALTLQVLHFHTDPVFTGREIDLAMHALRLHPDNWRGFLTDRSPLLDHPADLILTLTYLSEREVPHAEKAV